MDESITDECDFLPTNQNAYTRKENTIIKNSYCI